MRPLVDVARLLLGEGAGEPLCQQVANEEVAEDVEGQGGQASLDTRPLPHTAVEVRVEPALARRRGEHEAVRVRAAVELLRDRQLAERRRDPRREDDLPPSRRRLLYRICETPGMRWTVPLMFVALVASGCDSGQPTASSERIYVPQLEAAPLYKPGAVGFSVDGGDIWGIDRWISYGGRTARAVARTHTNDCVPSCVGGHRAYATTTVLFEGRVPCKGVRAYASFHVVRTTNASVAAVGDVRDLTSQCGYVAFTPSLRCLSHDRRAVSVPAQARCYENGIRTTDRKIAKREQVVLHFLYSPRGPRSFVHGEQSWREYRERACAAVASEYTGGTYEPVLRAACIFNLNESHLADLSALLPYSGRGSLVEAAE